MVERGVGRIEEGTRGVDLRGRKTGDCCVGCGKRLVLCSLPRLVIKRKR